VQQAISARSHLRHIPVIVITGLRINPKMIDVACSRHKPVSSADLLGAVRRCVTSASSSLTGC